MDSLSNADMYIPLFLIWKQWGNYANTQEYKTIKHNDSPSRDHFKQSSIIVLCGMRQLR